MKIIGNVIFLVIMKKQSHLFFCLLILNMKLEVIYVSVPF